MRSILISIKPKWAEAILGGRKTMELRRTCPRKVKERQAACRPYDELSVLLFIVYSGMVRGECRLDWVHLVHPSWCGEWLNLMCRYACVTEKEWRAYRPRYAWRVSRPVRYAQPVPLAEIGVARSPQSWQYLTPEQAAELERRATS